MTTIEMITGIILNVTGIFALIISLTKYFTGIEVMLNAHETYIESVIQPVSKPVIQITGTNAHLINAKHQLKTGLLFSISCLVVGFALQMTSVLLN